MMKNACLSLVLSCFFLSGLSYGVVLLEDTWADGSRTETDLPNESTFWAGHPDQITMGTNSLAYSMGTSSEKMWTYFTPNGSPVSVGVGQQLIATIQFTPRGGMYDSTSRNFRFGLFNDPTDSQILSDTNDDGGGTGDLGQDDPWTDSTGYGVQFALSSGTGTDANVGKRTDQTNNSLMGSSGAWMFTHAGDPIVGSLDTTYTLSLILDRIAADQMQVTFSISDPAGLISTHSILDDPTGSAEFGTGAIATNFDQLFFRLSKAEATADVVDFNSIKIELVPEPATLMLLGVGGLLARRRKHA